MSGEDWFNTMVMGQATVQGFGGMVGRKPSSFRQLCAAFTHRLGESECIEECQMMEDGCAPAMKQ